MYDILYKFVVLLQRSMDNLDETYDEDLNSVDTSEDRKLPKLVNIYQLYSSAPVL